MDALQSLMLAHAPNLYVVLGDPMFKVAGALIKDVWLNRIHPCLDSAEDREEARAEKEMWENMLDSGVIAGLQVGASTAWYMRIYSVFIQEFNDENGQKLGTSSCSSLPYHTDHAPVTRSFGDALYPPLCEVLTDDKSSLASIGLRKQVSQPPPHLPLH
jgi:hypothetical protein